MCVAVRGKFPPPLTLSTAVRTLLVLRERQHILSACVRVVCFVEEEKVNARDTLTKTPNKKSSQHKCAGAKAPLTLMVMAAIVGKRKSQPPPPYCCLQLSDTRRTQY